ncbi:hypothetical protein KO489_01425 [Reinekea forsetii]|nr:hypothetical protein [Reinekea forsetii]
MKYLIKAKTEIIGSTDLEYSDECMGIRHGLFVPSGAYSDFQCVFTELFSAEMKLSGNPGEQRIPELHTLSTKIREMELKLTTEAGNEIPVENIHIEDGSAIDDLKGEPLHVTAIVKNSETYAQYFSGNNT